MNRLMVAGDSAALSALLALSRTAAPWLTERDGELNIDWDLAWKSGLADCVSEVSRDELLAAAFELCPAVQLDAFAGSRLGFRKTEKRELKFARAAVGVTNEVASVMAPLAEELASLESVLTGRLAGKPLTDRRIDSLDRCLTVTRKARKLAEISGYQAHVAVTLDIRQRFAISRGDMRLVLEGRSRDYADAFSRSGASTERRTELWRLTRALLRSRIDLFETLPIRQGATGEPATEASVRNALVQLASHELRLFEALSDNPDRHLVTRNTVVGVRESYTFLLGSGAEETAIPIPTAGTPYAALYAGWHSVMENYGRFGPEFSERKLREALKRVETAAAPALKVLRLEVGRASAPGHRPPLAAALSASIHWLVAESPLLTMLASGVLAAYVEKNGASDRWGVCLSPWMTANLVAQKVLGALPLRFGSSGDGDGEPPAQDEDEGVAERRSSETTQLGRELWENVMRHLH